MFDFAGDLTISIQFGSLNNCNGHGTGRLSFSKTDVFGIVDWDWEFRVVGRGRAHEALMMPVPVVVLVESG